MEQKVEEKNKVEKKEEKLEKDLEKDVIKMTELAGENKRIIYDEDSKAYDFCPVTLKDLPKLIKLINELKDTDKMVNENPDLFIDKVAEITLMGLRKNKGLTKEKIKEKFTLESFQSVIHYATDVNGFFVPKMTRSMT